MMSLTLLFGSLLLLTPVSEDLPPLDRQSEAVHLDFTATAWFPRLIGTYSFGPNGTELDVETDTDLHDSELSFNGALDIRFDVWTIRVLGSDFDTTGNGRLDRGARVSGSSWPQGRTGRATMVSGRSRPRSTWRSGAPSPTGRFPGANPGPMPPIETPRVTICSIFD